MALLEIKNIHARVNGKEILKGVNLKLELGKVNALMGPNGSGKSTLASVLMAHPKYEVTQGKIFFNGEDITELSVDERAKKGIFLSFQYPCEIPGVSISNFIRTSMGNNNNCVVWMLCYFFIKKILNSIPMILITLAIWRFNFFRI